MPITSPHKDNQHKILHLIFLYLIQLILNYKSDIIHAKKTLSLIRKKVLLTTDSKMEVMS